MCRVLCDQRHAERPLRGGWSREGHSEEAKYENRDNYKERILGLKLEWDTTWTEVEMERKNITALHYDLVGKKGNQC